MKYNSKDKNYTICVLERPKTESVYNLYTNNNVTFMAHISVCLTCYSQTAGRPGSKLQALLV
jgi:hypothetical protein